MSFRCSECNDTGEILLFSSKVLCGCLAPPVEPVPAEKEMGTTTLLGTRFQKGQTLCRGDLDVFFTKHLNGVPASMDPVEVHYEVFHVPQAGALTHISGRMRRSPANPAVGEYYADLYVPPKAIAGDYQIKWSYRESVNSPECAVVQEFVVEDIP